MATPPAAGRNSRLRRLQERVAGGLSWTRPTSTEIGTVAKSGLAAGLAWWIARMVTDVSDPVLAALTAVVVVQVSVRASVRTAFQRGGAVVLGVLLALAIGDALALNALTVALLVAVSLGIAQLVLRLPPGSARQVPISGLVVLSAISASPSGTAWARALDTIIGAVIGVAIALLLPASRLVDARQTLERLGQALSSSLEAMGAGLHDAWGPEQTGEWRRDARAARDRLVAQAAEAIGNSREVARWNVRDRRHVDELGRYEEVLPRLERTAIGVSVISRGLDDHARLAGDLPHPSMAAMGALLVALAEAVRAVVRGVLGQPDANFESALHEVRARRQRCVQGASRRAQLALEQHEVPNPRELEDEWLSYAALLVQVDRIVGDLSAPLPD